MDFNLLMVEGFSKLVTPKRVENPFYLSGRERLWTAVRKVHPGQGLEMQIFNT